MENLIPIQQSILKVIRKPWKWCEISSKFVSFERYSSDFVIEIEILP